MSKFEFSVAVAVIAVIGLAGLDRLVDMQERTEKVKVEAVVRNLNSGLRYEMAHRIVAGREADIGALAGTNPVRWLQTPPTGYLGEFETGARDVAPGAWYFDPARGELGYRPMLHRNLRGAGSPPLLRWKVGRTTDGDSGLPAGGLAVLPAAPVQWY